MPGIFGGFSSHRRILESLASCFRSVWSEAEVEIGEEHMIGGHAHGEASALRCTGQGTVICLDGEYSLYRDASGPQFAETLADAFRNRDELTSVMQPHLGNLALWDSGQQILRLEMDRSGIFPLYYYHNDATFLFSSYLRPLVRVGDASPSHRGIASFLQGGYTFAGRTVVKEIRQLQAGQVLIYDSKSDNITIYETSDLWKESDEPAAGSIENAANEAWVRLEAAVRQAFPSSGKHAVMVSGGWDSRTLLASMVSESNPSRFLGYSHGDLRSRELRVAQQVCADAAVAMRLEPLDSALFDLSDLQDLFRKVEYLIFPYWGRAGAILAKGGYESVTAGVFGEILGGHYGHAMYREGISKIASVASSLLGFTQDRLLGEEWQDTGDLVRLFTQDIARTSYLTEEFWNSFPNLLSAVAEDIESDVVRLRKRGIVSSHKLVEAFISEHRGAQYIAAQLRSCRGDIDIAAPFADRRMLSFASRLDLKTKIHNRVNRRMLLERMPELLRRPLSATLLPASAPVGMQEASRLLRKIWEECQWRLNPWQRESHVPRLGWINFEFLRGTSTLSELTRELRMPFWNIERILSAAKSVESDQWRGSVHPLVHQFLKMYTIELMLRKVS